MLPGIRREGAENVSWDEENAYKKVQELTTDVALSPARASLKTCKIHLIIDPLKIRRLRH